MFVCVCVYVCVYCHVSISNGTNEIYSIFRWQYDHILRSFIFKFSRFFSKAEWDQQESICAETLYSVQTFERCKWEWQRNVIKKIVQWRRWYDIVIYTNYKSQSIHKYSRYLRYKYIYRHTYTHTFFYGVTRKRGHCLITCIRKTARAKTQMCY